MADHPAAGVGESDSYDDLPYPGLFFRQTHPHQLATAATLAGMTPAPPERCRVLELGGGIGTNLIAMAEHLSTSRFVGVERSQRQVKMGQALVAKLGLSNVELRAQDLMDIPADLGEFDYIICHGVYSWVPADVKQKILEICRKHLSSQGVAYVSYNTYPGWHMRAVVRDMLQFGAGDETRLTDAVTAARQKLAIVAHAVQDRSDPYAIYIKEEMKYLAAADDRYVIHEHLERVNEPCYFRDFIDRTSAAGLQYVGEAEPQSLMTDDLPAAAREALGPLDPIEQQQWMDFCRNTRFRMSLLCHREVALDRASQGRRFREFYFSTQLQVQGAIDVTSDAVAAFSHGSLTLKSRTPVVKAALSLLAEQSPRRFLFDDLLSRALARSGQSESTCADASETLASILWEAYIRGVVQAFVGPLDHVAVAGEFPVARPMARLAAQTGEGIPNFQNEKVPVSELGVRLLPLLDGSRSRKQLIDAMHPVDAANIEAELTALARASLILQ